MPQSILKFVLALRKYFYIFSIKYTDKNKQVG